MTIFLSYSWADKQIADYIYHEFLTIGINLKLDEVEIEYTESISNYMDDVRDSDYVIMLISDSYLRSPNCMYEVGQLGNENTVRKRVLPVMINNISFSRIDKRLPYIDHWQKEAKRLKELESQFPNSLDLQKERINAVNFSLKIDGFLNTLKDMKALDFKNDDPNIFVHILKRIGIDPLKYQRVKLDKLDIELYSCQINSSVPDLIQRKKDFLSTFENAEYIDLLLENRFLYSIGSYVSDLIDKILEIESNEANLTGFDTPLMQLTEKSIDELEELILKASKLDSFAAAHLYIKKNHGLDSKPKSTLINELIESTQPWYRISILSELLISFNLNSYCSKVSQLLRQLIDRIENQTGRDAWASLCHSQKILGNEFYTQDFIYAHYKFLRFNPDTTKPFLYPLLPLHNEINPIEDDYSQMLVKSNEDKLAVIWMLSLKGIGITQTAGKNYSIVNLSNEANNGIKVLIDTGLDYKEKWRLCNALFVTHSLNYLWWIYRECKSDDILNNTLTIHDPSYGEIAEPHSSNFYRTLGYMARHLVDNNQSDDAKEAISFLKKRYDRKRYSDTRQFLQALTIGLGYLGNWKPSLLMLEDTEPWFHQACINISQYWVYNSKLELNEIFEYVKTELELLDKDKVNKRKTLENIYDIALNKIDSL